MWIYERMCPHGTNEWRLLGHIHEDKEGWIFPDGEGRVAAATMDGYGGEGHEGNTRKAGGLVWAREREKERER